MQINRTKQCRLFLCVAFLFASAGLNAAQGEDGLSEQLQEMIKLGKKAPDELGKSIVEKIEKDPKGAYEFIKPKLSDSALTDQDLVVYVWAAGLTQNADAVEYIIRLSDVRGAQSPELRAACVGALAHLGGAKAGAHLLTQLDKARDGEERYGLLDLLGEMQYEPAVPKAIEVLKVDPSSEYWRPVFVFGKMGDVAVPFLIQQINHEDRNIRFNAIMVLGQWLLAPEATRPLQQRFWKEDDLEIRLLILASLEHTTIDMAAIGEFSQEVLTKEKNEKVRAFAQETLGNMPTMAKDLAKFKKEKKLDRNEFEREYAQIEKSAGKQGYVSALGVTSGPEDETRLKKLRERILQRNSDEAFYDYKDVNAVILKNRHLYGQPTTKPSK